YESHERLVGSESCIRDSHFTILQCCYFYHLSYFPNMFLQSNLSVLSDYTLSPGLFQVRRGGKISFDSGKLLDV
ncbi:MAG: hypothetical protein K2K20_06480, partial [Lachnospiraceae bacterium]|nr:hypothetical protein [Lachnospiraceae bacterium]